MFKDFKTEYINFLKQEIEYLKQQVEREKKRADLSVDALLSIKSNSVPIMPEKYDFDKKYDNKIKKEYELLKNEIESIGKEIGKENILEKEVIE